MKVTRLKLANVRAIKEAQLTFQPGFNLLVGVNGVGKTTVLDSLCVCLSATVKQAVKRLTRTNSLTTGDIRVGTEALTVECEVAIGKATHTFLYHKPRVAAVPQKKAGLPRQQVHDTPERAEFIGEPPVHATGKEPGGRPLAVYFSTRRAVATDRAPSSGAAAGGVPAAYAGAFSDRQLELGEFAAWMRVQEALKEEAPHAKKVLAAFERAVERFLPGYSKLRVDELDGEPNLLINRGKNSLPVRQLSDGERGTLALVLDLTRRLSQANPEMDDPASKAEAVVLIDEIDLHLHPRWQREIVGHLVAAFPKCQFITTTHSPQVIGEIEHDRIQVMSEGLVYSPSHSFGVDSSRVLEEIMGTRPRAKSVAELLSSLSKAVTAKKYKQARAAVASLAKQLGEDDPEVTRARTLLDFMEGDQ